MIIPQSCPSASNFYEVHALHICVLPHVVNATVKN